MPNWCENAVTIKHNNPSYIDKCEESAKEGKLFRTLHPCPQVLFDTVAGRVGRDEDYDQRLLVARQQLNIEFFGHKDWYDWCVANWGTKWDIDPVDVSRRDSNTLTITFNSAWCPPIQFYEFLESEEYKVSATYYEPGCGFVGEYSEGFDSCYDIHDCPEHLDQEYGISEWFEQEAEDA